MTRQFSKLWFALVIIALLAACGAQSDSQGNEVVKIGFFGPLSGDSASDGNNSLNAAKLAIDKANSSNAVPGKKFELVSYDDRLDGNEAATIAQKLASQDKVKAVIGGSYSTPTRAAAPLLQTSGIPLLAAYATHPEITTNGDMIFRVIYMSTVQGKAIATYSTGKLGYKRFHVLHIDNDYGNTMDAALQETIAAKGGAVVSDKAFSAQDSDFTPLLTAIKGEPADALILIGYYAQSAQIIQQARQLGVTLPIVGSDGLDSPKLVELGGKDVEGVMLATDFSRNDPRPVVIDFIRDFRAAYNTDPDVVASSTYDATNLLIDAIKRAGSTDSKAIRDALAATVTFEGVTGNIAFTPQREVNKTVLFVKIDKGAFVFMDKLDPAQLQ